MPPRSLNRRKEDLRKTPPSQGDEAGIGDVASEKTAPSFQQAKLSAAWQGLSTKIEFTLDLTADDWA